MSFRGTQFPQGGQQGAASYGMPGQPAVDPQASNQYAGNYHPQFHREFQPSDFSHSSNSHIDPLDTINRLIPSDNLYVKKFEHFTEKVEHLIDRYLGGAKPYVPTIGRFFIVATFLEDSMRIISQWKEQVYYLSTYRHLYPWLVKFFLLFNVVSMCGGSLLVIMRRKPLLATGLLSTIVLLQGIVYGLLFETFFFLRNVSVIGGLLLALSDSVVIDKRKLMMPGLPLIESKDHKKYFLLAGRIMLIVLFIAFIINAHFSIFSILVTLIGSINCISVAIGYKTKFSAAILTFLLAAYNASTNHYWSYDYRDTRRDYLRDEFIHTLSIVGGLLLIGNTGAGELSIDEKKKKY